MGTSLIKYLRHWRPITVVLVVAFLGIAAFLGLRTDQTAPAAPVPTPPPTIEVLAGKLETEPKTSAAVLEQVSEELSTTLFDLYSRAFLPPLPPPEPSPSADGDPSPPPTPIARRPAANYFQTPARTALAEAPDVFTIDPGTTIRFGRLRFSGIGTLRDDEPNAFVLQVTFRANGERAPPYGRPTPQPSPTPTPGLRIAQEGLLYMVRTGSGWRVAGFELELRERVEVGRRRIVDDVRAARWMP